MRAESVVVPAVETGRQNVHEIYIGTVVAVARSARRGEYVVFQLTSGLFLRTDRLGAVVVRALINGASASEAIDLVEEMEAGAGERAERLIFALRLKGAMKPAPPFRARSRGRLRRIAAQLTGLALSVAGPVVRVTPVALIAATYRLLLSSHPKGGQDREGSPDKPRRSFNYLFMYLSVILAPERLSRLVDRLFDRAAADEVASSLMAVEPAVGVFLHGPLFPAVPNALRNRGRDVVRVIAPLTHGINVSAKSGHLSYFFGDSPELVVEEDPTPLVASGALLRHLKTGRSIYIALDNIMFVRDAVTDELHAPPPAAEVEMLGHSFPRNDGPAWLAVRSGRPLVLWTTHCLPSGVVVLTSSPPLYPDNSLDAELRIATLSERLYAHAEAAIREHPEAWRYWSFLNFMTVKGREAGEGSVTPH